MEVIIGPDFPKKIIPLFDNAKKNIDIVSYDWRWYPDRPGHAVQQLNIALVRAVARGVAVRAVLNAAATVPVLQKVGIKARTLADRRTLHAKLILIDGHTAVIGSHNLTSNAFAVNIEASVAVEIPEGSTRLQEFFTNLYGL